jgi:putative membrane protein
MDLIAVIPPFLAILNTTAASLVSLGYFFVRRKNILAHRACMVSALCVSTVFMVFYLYYHAKVGNIPFAGVGAIRPVYFSLLATHVILAAVLFPLVLITAGLAIRGQSTRHRRIARWTLPIWLYVSVTGVIIYLMAFHIYAAE